MRMMKRGRTLLLYMLIGMLLLTGGLLPHRASAEGRAPAEYVFTDYAMSYQLRDFLNGYNVLAFGDVYLGLHCIGGLLVQGDYDGGPSNSGFADGQNMPPSYIKGRLLAPNSVYNSRNHRVDPLYVGSSNVVSSWQDWYTTYYSVNGLRTGSNGTTPVYISDHFFNFDLAYQVVKNSQVAMQQGSTPVQADEHGRITIPMGSQVTIASLEGVREINLTGDEHAAANTTINVLDEGDLHLPVQQINGRQPAVVEQADEGVSIVWSFPAAASLQLPTQNWLGHVIAPDADVSQQSGNYNGCIVCRNLYSSAEGHLYNYAARENTWTTVFSVHKVWNDGDNADGIRPDSVRVQLLSDGKPCGETVELRESDNWFHVWEKLPETDEDGNLITYTVQEMDVPEGYEVSYDQAAGAIINTHEYETVDISGTKTWRNESGWNRPWSITVRLYADGREVAGQVVNTSYWGGSNRYTFSGMPRYDEGREIVYTIREDHVDGYVTQIDGFNLINTYGDRLISISGTKVWDDGNDADGLRPAEVTVQLLANGSVKEEQSVTAGAGWQFTFSNLPERDDGGQVIAYTVREKSTPQGYTSTVEGYTITNCHESETTSVSGSKTWNDNDNQDGKRPASITIRLLAGGREVAQKTVTAADGWAWSFTGLPKCENGREIAYTITEDDIPGYTKKVSGHNVANTYNPETVVVSGSKTWHDDGDQDGKRPVSITIRLLAGGREVAQKTVTAADGWAWSFTGLPKYENGAEIVYTITEDAVIGYTTMIDGYDVINSRVSDTTSVSGRKLWFDDDDVYGRRPASITVYLLANGRQIASRTVTEADGWAWSFENLPVNENGSPIEYAVDEEPVPDYETFILGYNILNSYDRTTFSVTKIWEGPEGGDVVLTLYADGERLNPQPAYRREGSMYIWEELPVFNAEGEEIVYSATERYMDGYLTIYENVGPFAGETDRVYEGGTIINRGVVNVFVRKVWDGYEEGVPLPAIELVLYCNGEPTDVPMPQPDKHGWYKYYNLPAEVNGEPAKYTVRETKMNGYMAVYTNSQGEPTEECVPGGIITNYGVPATGDETPLLLWAVLMALSGAGLALLRRRHA